MFSLQSDIVRHIKQHHQAAIKIGAFTSNFEILIRFDAACFERLLNHWYGIRRSRVDTVVFSAHRNGQHCTRIAVRLVLPAVRQFGAIHGVTQCSFVPQNAVSRRIV